MTSEEPLKDVGYFAICDVATIRAVCREFGADVAAVYLCLILGSDGTGLRSSWGREAIRKRTGMSWRKVDRCITQLEKDGFINWPEKGSRIINIDLQFVETRPMREGYRAGLNRARNGVEPTTKREIAVHRQMNEDGWLDDAGKLIPQRIVRKAYLPLSLAGDIKGRPITGQTCIIERIRKARDPMAFLLLTEMYESHDLPEVGGTDRRFCWLKFKDQSTRFQTSQQKVILAEDPIEYMNRDGVSRDHFSNRGQEAVNAYFERKGILSDAGALEYVLGVFEDDEHDAQMVYPLGVRRHGKLVETEPENAVGVLAVGAAIAIKGDDNLDAWLDWANPGWIAPVDRMYRKAVIMGIPRLVARPRTKATQIWQAERMQICRDWADYFAGLIAEFRPDFLKENKRLREAVDFKDIPREHQGDINDLFKSP